MTKDLHMDATQYSTALVSSVSNFPPMMLLISDCPIQSIFFVGYLLAEVPSNMILARSRPSLYLPFIMGCWGCLTIAVQGVHSYGGLVALRFCLGIVESGFFVSSCFLVGPRGDLLLNSISSISPVSCSSSLAGTNHLSLPSVSPFSIRLLSCLAPSVDFSLVALRAAWVNSVRALRLLAFCR